VLYMGLPPSSNPGPHHHDLSVHSLLPFPTKAWRAVPCERRKGRNGAQLSGINGLPVTLMSCREDGPSAVWPCHACSDSDLPTDPTHSKHLEEQQRNGWLWTWTWVSTYTIIWNIQHQLPSPSSLRNYEPLRLFFLGGVRSLKTGLTWQRPARTTSPLYGGL
jgi:hypothetical protein